MPRKQEKNTWYPLDNAGVLYSAIQKERYSAVYRFSALMTKAVDPQALCRRPCRVFPALGYGFAGAHSGVILSPTPIPAPL